MFCWTNLLHLFLILCVGVGRCRRGSGDWARLSSMVAKVVLVEAPPAAAAALYGRYVRALERPCGKHFRGDEKTFPFSSAGFAGETVARHYRNQHRSRTHTHTLPEPGCRWKWSI